MQWPNRRDTLTIILVGVILMMFAGQLWSLYRFVSAGERFTKADGQVLCERISALDGKPCK
jgi:uncharacterized membrane protein